MVYLGLSNYFGILSYVMHGLPRDWSPLEDRFVKRCRAITERIQEEVSEIEGEWLTVADMEKAQFSEPLGSIVKTIMGNCHHYSDTSWHYCAINFGSINSSQVKDQRRDPLLLRATQSAEAGIYGFITVSRPARQPTSLPNTV